MPDPVGEDLGGVGAMQGEELNKLGRQPGRKRSDPRRVMFTKTSRPQGREHLHHLVCGTDLLHPEKQNVSKAEMHWGKCLKYSNLPSNGLMFPLLFIYYFYVKISYILTKRK